MNKFKVGDIVKLTATGSFHFFVNDDFEPSYFEVVDVMETTHPYGHLVNLYFIKSDGVSKRVDEDWIEIDVEYIRELKLRSLLDE